MRIIAGLARGRRLKMPKGEVRPSTDRLREALFSILSYRVQEARVLDLFAGTGSLGLEALSRGAKSAVFVEENRGVSRVTSDNLKMTQLNGKVVAADALGFLKRDVGCYDVIFADPPYAKGPQDEDFAQRLLESENLQKRLADGGLFVLEVWKDRSLPQVQDWNLVDDRCYGVCRILFYEKAAQS